jgi:hypothetical protein
MIPLKLQGLLPSRLLHRPPTKDLLHAARYEEGVGSRRLFCYWGVSSPGVRERGLAKRMR